MVLYFLIGIISLGAAFFVFCCVMWLLGQFMIAIGWDPMEADDIISHIGNGFVLIISIAVVLGILIVI
jgi:hypothetical protein